MKTEVEAVTGAKKIPVVGSNGTVSHGSFVSIRPSNTNLSQAEFKAKTDNFIKNIANIALSRSDSIVTTLLPNGKREGNEWVALNPNRTDKSLGSFKINLNTGIWTDFATGEKGGADFVSLVAHLQNLKPLKAANYLANMLNLEHFDVSKKQIQNEEYILGNSKTQNHDSYLPIVPVPADVHKPDPKNRDAPEFYDTKLGKPESVAAYVNENGELCNYILRYPNNKDGSKNIKPLTYGALYGKTTWQKKGIKENRTLYNLKYLVDHPDKPVLIVEGEKAADAAIKLYGDEYCVITSSFGAHSAGKTDWKFLKDRDVTFCPDHDKDGQKYLRDVAKLTVDAGVKSFRVVEIPSCFPEHWDLADELPEGFSFESIKALLDNAVPLNLEEIIKNAVFPKNDSDNQKNKSVPIQPKKTKKNVDPVAYRFQNERNFVESCLQDKDLKVLPNGMIEYSDGRIVEKLLKEVREYFAGFEKHLVKNIRPSFFDDLIWKIVEERKLVHRQKVINDLGKYVPDPDNNLKKACDLLGGCDQRLALFVLENFIRQIKQKMNGVEVTLPLVVIIVGGGHIGKTDFCRKVLLKPLKYLYTEPKLNDITETDKNYQLFHNNFALLCEEMSGANKTEIETLKHIITALFIQARIFHSQDRVQVPNNATLIGTSNKRIWETIKDPTTMRRFIDLPVESIDFNSFHTIDTSALWQGVKYDLNKQEKDTLFAEYKELVQPLQEESRHRDDLEDWIEQYSLKHGTYFANYKYLYKKFESFLSYSGKKMRLTVKDFSKLLRDRHRFEHKHTNKGDGIRIDFEAFEIAKNRWEMPTEPEKLDSNPEAPF